MRVSWATVISGDLGAGEAANYTHYVTVRVAHHFILFSWYVLPYSVNYPMSNFYFNGHFGTKTLRHQDSWRLCTETIAQHQIIANDSRQPRLKTSARPSRSAVNSWNAIRNHLLTWQTVLTCTSWWDQTTQQNTNEHQQPQQQWLRTGAWQAQPNDITSMRQWTCSNLPRAVGHTGTRPKMFKPLKLHLICCKNHVRQINCWQTILHYFTNSWASMTPRTRHKSSFSPSNDQWWWWYSVDGLVVPLT